MDFHPSNRVAAYLAPELAPLNADTAFGDHFLDDPKPEPMAATDHLAHRMLPVMLRLWTRAIEFRLEAAEHRKRAADSARLRTAGPTAEGTARPAWRDGLEGAARLAREADDAAAVLGAVAALLASAVSGDIQSLARNRAGAYPRYVLDALRSRDLRRRLGAAWPCALRLLARIENRDYLAAAMLALTACEAMPPGAGA